MSYGRAFVSAVCVATVCLASAGQVAAQTCVWSNFSHNTSDYRRAYRISYAALIRCKT